MVINRVIMKKRCVLQCVTRPQFSRRLKNKSSEDDVKYTPEEHVEYDLLERIRKHNREIPHEEHEWETEMRESLERGEELSLADDQWIYTVDNAFAEAFLRSIEPPSEVPFLDPPVPTLCERCSILDLDQPIYLANLNDTANLCDVCRLLSQCFEGIEGGDDDDEATTVHILESQSRVRVCAAPGEAHHEIQVGFPVLPDQYSPLRFNLFREWLRVCDEQHRNRDCHLEARTELPTRVVDIGVGYDSGSGEDPDLLRLYVPESGRRGDYTVLSHCWGRLSDELKRTYCTTRANVGTRCARGFDAGSLPRTFRDAIRVTRELGVRYIWIDSLCIVQDDEGDWARESRRMETAFRNAYCTIAAASARDSTKGFLGRATPTREPYVMVRTSSHGPVYICGFVDDFERDVERDSVLNKRAWVLQERALSRRTIHFTAGQTYWECGNGIRCETLTSVRSSKALFLGDPRFPEFVKFRGDDDQIRLFQHLFTRYSQLGLTVPTDKPVAIAGLEQRLAETMQTPGRYGVTEKYLHRGLLWQRAGAGRLRRIRYGRGRGVPSWSWMAYDGQIEYMDIEFGSAEWNRELWLQDNALKTKVYRFKGGESGWQNCGIHVAQDTIKDPNIGWVKYDEEGRTDIRNLRCVIVGREKDQPPSNTSRVGQRYCVLIVISATLLEGICTFKRVGVGFIPPTCIAFDRVEVSARVG